MRIFFLATVAVLGLCNGAAALEMIEARYICERDVVVPVTYVNGDEPHVALWADDRLILLPQVESGSGARYADGGASYVWWSKGDTGRLEFTDSEKGEKVTLFASCTVQE
ncbi:MliC family protein [Pseudooceanicola algae]|uniref:C-type lysozyme inhibitor domain-containing protein n=1 Tax=Pseudooceanicola algae TaxID=1537215 RepID=A0A418SFP1_9RHOB|nr:MliC family protein [Pseudooceanicola algae]QPM89866.1 hypothetical protein PSAL_010950 [Pseudooceanicola algae]